MERKGELGEGGGRDEIPKLAEGAKAAHNRRMDRGDALQQLRAACNQISAQITQMHPIVPKLADAPTQGEVLKGLFELTKQVEVVKKHLIRLEKSDDSKLV